jgi:hypothetical protein
LDLYRPFFLYDLLDLLLQYPNQFHPPLGDLSVLCDLWDLLDLLLQYPNQFHPPLGDLSVLCDLWDLYHLLDPADPADPADLEHNNNFVAGNFFLLNKN